MNGRVSCSRACSAVRSGPPSGTDSKGSSTRREPVTVLVGAHDGVERPAAGVARAHADRDPAGARVVARRPAEGVGGELPVRADELAERAPVHPRRAGRRHLDQPPLLDRHRPSPGTLPARGGSADQRAPGPRRSGPRSPRASSARRPRGSRRRRPPPRTRRRAAARRAGPRACPRASAARGRRARAPRRARPGRRRRARPRRASPAGRRRSRRSPATARARAPARRAAAARSGRPPRPWRRAPARAAPRGSSPRSSMARSSFTPARCRRSGRASGSPRRAASTPRRSARGTRSASGTRCPGEPAAAEPSPFLSRSGSTKKNIADSERSSEAFLSP